MNELDSHRIRVLVVDDSAVIRKIIASTLLRVDDVEVVGTAASGEEAIARFKELRPDVVTLDVEMPGMNGIEAVSHIRAIDRNVPIIMFSTLTESGGTATLDALAMGATDYVTKPSNSSNLEVSKEIITATLVNKIRVLGSKKTLGHSRPQSVTNPLHQSFSNTSPTHRPTVARVESKSTNIPIRDGVVGSLSISDSQAHGAPRGQVDHVISTATIPKVRNPLKAPSVILIGISTGGPNALSEVIPALPSNLAVPIVVVQHMPATFTRLLAERLDSKSRVSVKEACGGEVLRAGEVYIAPGEHHLVITSAPSGVLSLALDESAPVNSCKPAVDVLFRSAVKLGSKVTAIVMTGMGQDGLVGARELKGAGAEIITQDEASSVVWGMPGYVTNAGLSDQVLPLESIATFITNRASGMSQLGLHPALDSKPLVSTSAGRARIVEEIGDRKWH